MDKQHSPIVVMLMDDSSFAQELGSDINKGLGTECQIKETSADNPDPYLLEQADTMLILSEQDTAFIKGILDRVNKYLPDYPIAVISRGKASSNPKDLILSGALTVINVQDKNKEEILAGVRQLLSVSKKNAISGVGIAVALQMLELERKTCTLAVKKNGQKGLLFFKEGELLQAELKDKKGVDAAIEIATWENVQIEFRHFCRPIPDPIDTPLAFILLESSRQKDEVAQAGSMNEEKAGGALDSQLQQEDMFGTDMGKTTEANQGDAQEIDSLEGLDGIDFDVAPQKPPFDLEKEMTDGPIAQELWAIKKALTKVIGPVASTILKQQAEIWAKDTEPSKENLDQLIDLICVEIEDDDLIYEFRTELII